MFFFLDLIRARSYNNYNSGVCDRVGEAPCGLRPQPAPPEAAARRSPPKAGTGASPCAREREQKAFAFERKTAMSEQGKFIVIEGLDGSGKGTQIARLAAALSERGVRFELTAEPTPHATGGLVRDALGGITKRTPSELAGLFLADRIAHCQNPRDGIAALLKQGVTVVCDRYYYSSFAYQGMDLGLDWVMSANLGCPAILKPDLCIFLDVPTEVADRRISLGRSSREIFEQAETIERVRRKYFEVFGILSDTHNVKIINAARTPDEVFADVWAAAAEILDGTEK